MSSIPLKSFIFSLKYIFRFTARFHTQYKTCSITASLQNLTLLLIINILFNKNFKSSNIEFFSSVVQNLNGSPKSTKKLFSGHSSCAFRNLKLGRRMPYFRHFFSYLHKFFRIGEFLFWCYVFSCKFHSKAKSEPNPPATAIFQQETPDRDLPFLPPS